jgi:hypothetical protein
MNLLDDNLFAEGVDDTEPPAGLAVEEKDLLKSLETMAAEIESEPENSN